MVSPAAWSARHAARLVAAVAGAALIGTVMSAPASAQSAPEGPSEHTDLGLDGDAVMGHLRALSDIALDHADDGYRAVGTEGYDAAAAYVEEQLAESGAFDTSTRQEFPATWDAGGEISLTVDGTDVADPGHMSFAEGTTSTADGVESGDGAIEGAPLSFPTGTVENAELGCDAEAYEGFTPGHVALVTRGECAFSEKVQAAADADAAAVLIYNNADGPLNGTLGARLAEAGRIPGLGLTGEAGTALAEQLADAEEPLLVDASFTKEFFAEDSYNILADTTAGSDDEVIVIGAHLDGVAEGPGVNDNASGVAALLALADQIGAYEHDNDRTIRLAFWGAEEVGLQGSNFYVADLEDAELATIQSYLNYDMIGSENYTVGVYDANESTHTAPVDIPEGSADLEQVYTDFFDAQGQPWVDSKYSGRSDYAAFIAAGVPSGGLFSGADEIKTEEEFEMFGGEAGVQLDRNYHRPDDTIENVNEESIGIFAPAIGWAAHAAAWDLVDEAETTTPTPAPTTGAPSAEPTDDPTTPPVAGGGSDLPRTGADLAATLSVAALLIAMGLIIAMTAKARYRTGRR